MARPTECIEMGSRRKSTVWTREKIAQLIELYQHHECLWNHYTEDYRHKEKRRRAIDEICSRLQITKMDFGKKIHNLRNQFNSEMKKLERRVEETGDDTESTTETCRWKHFQSLKFLRDIIEPRPGGGGYQPKVRKTDSYFKYDAASEEEAEEPNTNVSNVQSLNASSEQITEYQFEDMTIAVVTENEGQENKKEILVETGSKGNDIITAPQANGRVQNVNVEKIVVSKSVDTEPPQMIVSQCQTAANEENLHGQSARCCNKSKDQCTLGTADMSFHKDDNGMLIRSRDQWDAFGELVATEIRNLNSDTFRKKLKRKILQAILEVGEEDDRTTVNL